MSSQVQTQKLSNSEFCKIAKSVCKDKNLEEIKKFAELYDISGKTIIKNTKTYFLFEVLSEIGYLEAIEWLTESCKITEKDAKYRNMILLTALGKRGNPEILEWFTKKFNVTEEDMKGNILKEGSKHNILLWLISLGNLKSLKWLVKNYESVGKELNSDSEGFFLAVFHGKFETLKWLYCKFNMKQKYSNDPYFLTRAFQTAQYRGHDFIFEWIRTSFCHCDPDDELNTDSESEED